MSIDFPRRVARLVWWGVLVSAVAVGTLAIAAWQASAASSRVPSVAPCIAAGHGPGVIPAISFGRKRGNVRPFSVGVYADGTIAYTSVAPAVTHYVISPEAVLGLERLATAEGFAAWPNTITATRGLPDVATLFVTLRAGCSSSTRTVDLQGGASLPAFGELFATLEAATALAS
jgi:hypothetical protein